MSSTIRSLSLLIVSSMISAGALAGGFEKPTGFGAFNAALGGAGYGYNPTGSAVFYNPANIMFHIRKWMFGSDMMGFISYTDSDFKVPVLGLNVSDKDSETIFLPMGSFGMAYRTSDAVAIGIGIYSPAGMASEFKDVGSPVAFSKMECHFLTIEAAPFIAFLVSENFAISIQYRVLYGLYNFEIQSSVVGNTRHKDVDGFSFLGFRIGVAHKVNDNIRWGFQIRSEMTSEFEGKTTATLPASAALPTGLSFSDSTVKLDKFYYPWEFAGGFAYIADEQAFTIIMDFGIRLYGRNDTFNFDVDAVPGDEAVFDQIVDWLTSIFIRAGAEIHISGGWFGRFGLGLITPATNKDSDSPLLTTPSMGGFFGLGAGYVCVRRGEEQWRLGFSYDFNIGSTDKSLIFSTLGNTVRGERNGYAHSLNFSVTFWNLFES